MQALIDYMLRFGSLSQEQMTLVQNSLYSKVIKKGEYLSEAGKIIKDVYFLTDGICRVCYYNNKGDEFTRCFITENRFATDMNSFYNELPSAEYVEALTDCELVAFSKETFNYLRETIPALKDIFTKMTSAALMRKLKESQAMLSQDAGTRYLNFLEIYAGLANKIPLAAVASYLGITQSSLSRIRKNIS
ncbi:MAG TPA: Crp/Fnr family transcriptional regulator [Arachidicoccus sp.]